jgi:hypothetical protein
LVKPADRPRCHHGPCGVLAGGGVIVLAALLGAQTTAIDPLAFFAPLSVSSAERARILRGEAVVKNLPARGAEVAVLAVSRTTATGEGLAAWIGEIARLKAGPQILGIGRLSNPPRIEDLAALSLDDDDLADIRRCRPGDCGVRLSGAEMTALQAAAAAAGAGWREAVQAAFRRAILARAEAYRASGQDGALPYEDRRPPIAPGREFQLVLDASPFLTARAPTLAEYLRVYPYAAEPGVESFLYWSKEDLGRKPIVALTHVVVLRSPATDLPDALVVSRQVYASHYMTGALAVTAITSDGSSRYLVYLNRSRLDVFGGMFGGLVRSIIDRRLRGEAAEVVDAVRRRLESGPPP